MIDSILIEWSYRLKHGYPTTNSDYDILLDVLLEMTDIDTTAATDIISKLKSANTHVVSDTIESSSNYFESLVIS